MAPLVELVRGPVSESINEMERRGEGLPAGQDFHFYSNFREFRRPVADVRSRVENLLTQFGTLKGLVHSPAAFPADVDEGYDWLVGVQDAFLEKVDASLDKFYLERKAESKQELNAFEAASKQSLSNKTLRSGRGTSEGSSKTIDVKVATGKDKLTTHSRIPYHIPSIPRPQDRFDDAVDNSNTPFRHNFLKGRMNTESIVSTANGIAGNTSAVSTLEEHAKKLGHRSSVDNTHPLQEELTKMAYVEDLAATVEIKKHVPLHDTPLTFVTTLKVLKEMAVKLRKAGEIAVDLEHHHYRSYQGFVCLLQVSTRYEDFIVDTLDLRSQIGPCLGDIFADPTIKKVMHGADRDIVWLQRDFGIYVCNLFDTGQAARVLQLQGFGLAFLLEHFCKVNADKRYQRADWRIRPLPAEMVKYAREDTHYLLYVHDMLKQSLWNARADNRPDMEDPIIQVHKRCRDLCLKLYTKGIFTETSYQHLYGLNEKNFRAEQLAVLAALYSWRDSIARKEDESTGFVLPNHLLFQLASEMPDNVPQLQSVVKGSYVSRHARAVIKIIRRSKEKALKELQELDLNPEDGELTEESPTQGTASDEMNTGVSMAGHSVQIKEIGVEGDKEDTMETSKSPNSLSTETLITMETKTRTPVLDPVASNSFGGDEAGHFLTHRRSGDMQSKLTSNSLTGPLVVSRKTTSSLVSRKSGKITSVPLPSSHVWPHSEARDGASAVQDLVTHALMTPILATDVSLQSVDQEMPDAGISERDTKTGLAEGHKLDEAQGRTGSDSFTAEVSVTSVETTGGVSLATVEAPDSVERDKPFTEPGNSPLPVTNVQGETSEDKSIVPASTVIERFFENAPVTPAKKKPSKLGALLGGRRRVRQTSCESIKDVEQARTKTQNIESSMVLPFGPPVESLANMPGSSEQLPFIGEVQAITMQEETLTECNGKLHEETAKPIDEETSERPVIGTTLDFPEVFMLETPADKETGPRELRKHRAWWPPMGDNTGNQRNGDSRSPRSGPWNHPSDPSDGDRDPDIPMSLSDMHRNSQRGKKGRSYSNCGDSEVPEAMNFDCRGSGSRSNKRKREQSFVSAVETQGNRVPKSDNMVHFRSFDYGEARDALGLENLFAEKAEDRQGTSSKGRGRGRGSKKDSNRPGIPLSKTAFDPLRRTREEPRPVGIKPGQRRQVFPQSGNRTAVFKQ